MENSKLQGSLSAEVWPPYLSLQIYAYMVLEAIRRQDFKVHELTRYREDGQHVFLVGESYRSRLIMVVESDPRGVIRVLHDDGTTCNLPHNMTPRVQPSFSVAKFITLGELTKDNYRSVVYELELDKHRNARLSEG